MILVEPPISDEAVKNKTSKNWGEWFAILDAAGSQSMTHKQIVAFLVEEYALSPWWQQMVTVTYEQARGLRQKHEMPSGYQISRSRTMAVPVERVFTAWIDENQRANWLNGPAFVIRKASPNKSLRISWMDGQSSLDVSFYPKGPAKTQITVMHNQLSTADDAERMKTYWANALVKLDEYFNH